MEKNFISKNEAYRRLPWLTAHVELLTITDPAKDPDDENVMALLGNFTIQGLVHLLATVANLSPAGMRAHLARVTYDLLGLPFVPVGIGSSCAQDFEYNKDDYQWNAPYVKSNTAMSNPIIDGQQVLLEGFKKAKPKSITLLLISGMTDACRFIIDQNNLFLEKIKEVVIMGGVERKNGSVVFNNIGLMIPDSAANNDFDMKSARKLYYLLQVNRVPIWILTREAAYAVPFPRVIYDEMALTGHPMGIRLRDMQRASIENLWLRANLPPYDKRRELPPRCDKAWFLNTFCQGKGMGSKETDSVWDLVESFHLYDPMAIIAAIPQYRHVFYEPHVVDVLGMSHYIVGLDNKNHGVKYPVALRGFIHSKIIEALDIFSQALGTA